MTTHPFDILPLQNGAGIIFTPCPGTKAVELKESLSQLKAAGASAVLSMTPPSEMQKVAVGEMPALCAELQMDWFNLPVEDDCAPEVEFDVAWKTHQETIVELVKQGKAIVIHCMGGTGRTGLMAAVVQLALGISLADATRAVQSVRPKSLTIPAHVAWVKQYAEQRNQG